MGWVGAGVPLGRVLLATGGASGCTSTYVAIARREAKEDSVGGDARVLPPRG